MALARKPFVVIDAEILSSSVWSESAPVRLVWLTVLILCDTEGYVGASVPGIARAAGVSLKETREALNRLMAPDPDSRTQANDGRRVEPAERGFRILNFKEHLDRLSAERRKTRDRVRKFRERKRLLADGNVTVLPGNRDQGEGTREELRSSSIPVGREVGKPADPPADVKAEKRIRDSKVGDERRLLALVAKMEALDPDGRDAASLMQMVTAYDRADGKRVGGCVNPATLSYERVQKSIADAMAMIEIWGKARGAGQASTVHSAD